MNITPSKKCMQNKPNDTTISEQFPHKIELNSLPIDVIENIGSRLTYPDVCNLRLVCRHTFRSISNRIVMKAKYSFYYKFPNMKKYSQNRAEIDYLNKAVDWACKKSSCHQCQFFSINTEGCVVEQIGVPRFRNFFSRFEIENYIPTLGKLYDSKIYFDTGVLENGLLFLKAPNPRVIKGHVEYHPKFNKAVWFGNTHLSLVGGQPNFYSCYVGESFEMIAKIFKIKNNNEPLASQIEDMLKNSKKIFF